MKVLITALAVLFAVQLAHAQIPEPVNTNDTGYITGGAGFIKMFGNPNKVAKLATIDQRYSGSFAWDTVTNTLYQYNPYLTPGQRWQKMQMVKYTSGAPGGGRDTSYKFFADTTNRQLYVCNTAGCVVAGGGSSVTASNGLTLAAGDIKLGGTLSQSATIGTSSINQMKITGLQSANNTDSLVTVDPITGALRRRDAGSLGSGATMLTAKRIAIGSSTNTVTSDSAITYQRSVGLDVNNTSVRQQLIVGDTLYPAGSQIIFYGNSITQAAQNTTGTPVSHIASYPTFVSNALNATEINKGIGGTGLYNLSGCIDSNMLCRYIIPYVSTTRYIMYMYGPQGASTDPTIDVPTYTTKLNALIDSTIAKGYPQNRIVILGWILTGRNNSLSDTCVNYRLDTLQAGVSSRRGVNFVSTYQYMKVNGGLALVSSDSLHPNAQGQMIIAQAILTGLGHNYKSGDFKVIGNETITGNSVISGNQAVGGKGSFGDSVRIVTNNRPAIGIIGTGASIGHTSGVRFSGLQSLDTFYLNFVVGNSYVNYLNFLHGVTPLLTFHNNNNVSFGTLGDFGYKLNIGGSTRIDGDLVIQAASNNHSVLNMRNPTFAGGSYIEEKWFGGTATDTFRWRHTVISGAAGKFELLGKLENPILSAYTSGAIDIGYGAEQTQKFSVNGSAKFAGVTTISPSANNQSALDLKNPVFAVNSYLEQRFFGTGAGDTFSIRHTIQSGGDRTFGIYKNGVPAIVTNGTTGFTAIGKSASAFPSYLLDIDAKTGLSGNPLRLQGLNLGSKNDSVVVANAGVFKEISAKELIGYTDSVTMTATILTNSVLSSSPFTITVAGASPGDFVDIVAVPDDNDLTGLIISAWVSTANTVSYQIENRRATSVVYTSKTIKARIRK